MIANCGFCLFAFYFIFNCLFLKLHKQRTLVLQKEAVSTNTIARLKKGNHNEKLSNTVVDWAIEKRMFTACENPNSIGLAGVSSFLFNLLNGGFSGRTVLGESISIDTTEKPDVVLTNKTLAEATRPFLQHIDLSNSRYEQNNFVVDSITCLLTPALYPSHPV